MNAALVADRQVTAQELQLFVREMMVEEEVTWVVWICLDSAAIGIGVRYRIIEQFDEHGKVVSELWDKALLLPHLVETEYIDRMLIQEEVVLLTENL